MSFYNKLKNMTNTTSKPVLEPKIKVDYTQNTIPEINDIKPDSIPLSFIKQYLRIDHDLDDIEILIHLRSAQLYVRTYTKTPKTEELDDGLLMPILALTSYFYENKTTQMASTEKLDITFGNVLEIHRRDIL